MTSGMVALVPVAGDAAKMAVDGGEDPEQMHVTLAYLGDNAVNDMPPAHQQGLHQVMADLAGHFAPISARVAGHVLFNPDGGPDGDRTPCAAYLVSDSPELAPLRESVLGGTAVSAPDATQYEPWIPHITGAYDRDAGALHFAGPVNFDRLRVAIGGKSQDYPLSDSLPDEQDGSEDGELKETADSFNSADGNASDLEQDGTEQDGTDDRERKSMADVTITEDDLAAAFALLEVKDGSGDTSDTKTDSHCLPDGSYRIDHPGQLRTAINALTAHKVDKAKRPILRRHVIKHAKRLGATNMLPDSITNEKDDEDDAKSKSNKDILNEHDDLEVKKVVASQAGVNRYHKPIGTQLGTPRDAAAAKAQQNTDAVNAYKAMLAGNTKAVAPLDKMDDGDLEDLTRVAYSYKSTDPKVVALRIQLANELARRGKKVTDFGALGGGKGGGKGKVPPGKHTAKRPAKRPGLPAGVRMPHQEGGAVKSLIPTEPVDPDSPIQQAMLEYKSKYSAAECAAMAKTGEALPDGSYPIKTRADLKSAIGLRNHGKGYSKATVYKHIRKRAKALGAQDMLPDDLNETKDGISWDGTGDAFTAGVLLGLAGLEPDEALEIKAGPPGHTFPSADPRAAKLRRYWTRGKGALKIRWGEPHDFDRCVEQMTKYVGARARGLCNIYHRVALGVAPGQEDKPGGVAKRVAALAGKSIELPYGLEFKSAQQLWVPDPSSVDGWRAQYSAWEADRELIEEMKALRRPDPTADPGADPAAATPDEQPNTDRDTQGDDEESTDADVLSKLDQFAQMAPDLTEEAAYEQAIGDDIPWALEARGDLVESDENGNAHYDDDVTPPNEQPDSDDTDLSVGDDQDGDQEGDDEDDGGPMLFDDDADADGDVDDGTGDDTDGDADASEDMQSGGDGEDGGQGGDDANGDTAESGGQMIPEVAELLAELMADETADEQDATPGDDADRGQSEEDGGETHPTKRRVPATA